MIRPCTVPASNLQQIVSRSMHPTLAVGDHVLVDKVWTLIWYRDAVGGVVS